MKTLAILHFLVLFHTNPLYHGLPCDETVSIPSSFTPNGDSINDCFSIKFSKTPAEFELKIFNRWGEEVFYDTDYRSCWRGGKKAKDDREEHDQLEAGVYLFVLAYKNPETDSKHQCTGSISLLR